MMEEEEGVMTAVVPPGVAALTATMAVGMEVMEVTEGSTFKGHLTVD